MIHIGIDIGGTFTDLLLVEFDAESKTHIRRMRTIKLLTTPKNPIQAILEGLLLLELDRQEISISHGSTLAINALIENRQQGAERIALITTQGFADLLRIARQNRPLLYDLQARRTPPLVAAHDTFEIAERMLADGTALVPPDDSQIHEVASRIAREPYTAVAICLLHAYANSSHEIRVANALEHAWANHFVAEEKRPIVALSSQVAPQIREYERCSTTVIHARLAPLLTDYLANLEHSLEALFHRRVPVSLMRSDGGAHSLAQACAEPLQSLFSGPCGGLVAARVLARYAGFEKIITLDMGGTSTDVSLVDQDLRKRHGFDFHGLPILISMLDIHAVGAGGGSIVRLDASGSLRVGPESAGAEPGPLCFGQGTELTLTDIYLLMGMLDSRSFLGGRFHLDLDRAQAKLQELAQKMGVKPQALAQASLDQVELHMEQAIRYISVERGIHPEDFTLVAFGGAGGLHAVSLAQKLGMETVMIPPFPGTLSALGMVLAQPRFTRSHSVLLNAAKSSFEDLRIMADSILQDLVRLIQDHGVTPQEMITRTLLEMRYQEQAFELGISLTPRFVEEFHRTYEMCYGLSHPEKPVEIVHLRCEVCALEKSVTLPEWNADKERRTARPVSSRLGGGLFRGERIALPIYERESLPSGTLWEGPALITEYSATSFLPPHAIAHIDPWGNLLMKWKRRHV